MPSRVKSPKYSARLFNDQGQAAIEYILLLVVTISLLLLLVAQFFTPLQNFLYSYMHDYTACLLETGALPSFGNQDSSIETAEDMGCKFGEFAKGSAASMGSRSGSSSASAGDGSNGSSGGSKSSSSSESGSDSSSSSSGSSSSSRMAGRGGISRSRRGRAGIGEATASNSKVTAIQVEQLGAGNGFFKTGHGSDFGVQSRTKRTAVNMNGWTDAEKKKLENRGDAGRTIAVASGDLGPAPKKIAVKPPDAKAVVQEEDHPFTVGNFIRYLFIAALIIALVIFLGGQALSMSKGSEN